MITSANPDSQDIGPTRRGFLKLSSAALLASAGACRSTPLVDDFPIAVESSLLRGHLLFEAAQYPRATTTLRKQVLVVGAGIAGLAAACRLKQSDLVVCEVGAMLGGSSSAMREDSGIAFAQGAHYELPYPKGYGEQALAFLEQLNLIRYDAASAMWTFVDRQYIIDDAHDSRTWTGKEWRDDPLPASENGKRLIELLETFHERMPMPTRLIKSEYRSYNQINFAEWLKTMNLAADSELRQAIDYQLRDDYGAGADEVSALAAFHYYQCRPYYRTKVPHFSPPEGNAYFVDRFAGQLPGEALRRDHLVAKITPDAKGFLVDVLDLKNKQWLAYHVDGIVYAGQKHALKYTFPADAALFSHNRYAPWMTVSFVLEGFRGPVYWQNESIAGSGEFLGFVNSRAQHGGGERTVLTAYFCLPQTDRKQLQAAQQEPRPWVQRALQAVNQCLGTRIDRLVIKAYVKLHGHAMPIPTPGYLFKDGNQNRNQKRLVYAGVDNGRLPLFFEALDSGLVAADLLHEELGA